jgi:preprotein translocase subunit SecE
VQKDDSTWLWFSYFVFAALIALSIYRVADLVSIQMGWVERYDTWLPNVKLFGSLAIGLGSMFWLQANAGRHDFYLNSIMELRKVSWPTADETRQMTIIVLIFVAIFAAILGAFDFVWNRSMGFILGA